MVPEPHDLEQELHDPHWFHLHDTEIKYLDVGPQAQLPPPYAENISALLTIALS